MELSKTLLTKIKSLLEEIQNQIRNTLFTDLPDACFNDLDIYRQNIYDYLKTIYGAA